MKEIAETRVRYGYRWVHVLLRREGWAVDNKRTYKLYDKWVCNSGRSLRRGG